MLDSCWCRSLGRVYLILSRLPFGGYGTLQATYPSPIFRPNDTVTPGKYKSTPDRIFNLNLSFVTTS